MFKLLTLCTAAYNSEKTIAQMIDSVMLSKYCKMVEIIIVNDGSSDHTEEIVRKYEKKYPDCIKVLSKENGGSGSARNLAVQYASGKYTKLLDADDWIDTRQFDLFLEKLKDIDADVIWNGHYVYTVKKSKKIEVRYFSDMKSEKIYTVSEDEFLCPSNLEMHGVTYRTSIIIENNLKLSEGMPYVDLEYLLLPIPFINTVVYLDIPFYVYQYGIAGQSVDPNIMKKKGDKILKMVNRLLHYYDIYNEDISESAKELMRICLAKACNTYLNVIFIQEDFGLIEKAIQFDRMIKQRDKKLWNKMSNLSGSLQIMRLKEYKGYYLMVILHKINRLIKGW